MNKPILVIKLHQRDYEGHINLGNSVYEALLNNIYITSTTPPLNILRASIDETSEAHSKWGTAGNRGSHLDMETLRHGTLNLGLNLKSLLQSVQTTAQQMAGSDYALMRKILSTTGFEFKKAKAPQGRLEEPQDLRTIYCPYLNINQVKVKWEKPFSITAVGNVKLYKLYMSLTPDFDDAVLLATTTKTSFVYTNNSEVLQHLTFWVVPVNTVGDGARSKAIFVRLLNP